MSIYVNVLQAILNQGFGPLRAHDNQFIFYFVLGISVILFITEIYRFRRIYRENKINSGFITSVLLTFFSFLFLYLCDIGILYLVWLGLGTHHDILFFSPPPQSRQFYVFSLLDIYHAFSRVLHFIVLLLSLLLLFISFSTAYPKLRNELYSLPIIITVLIGLEIGDWPIILTISSEIVSSVYFIFTSFANVQGRELPSEASTISTRKMFVTTILELISLAAASFVILLTHQITVFFINMLWLYFTLLVIDSIAANFYSFFYPLGTNYLLLSPRRWIFTVPITIGITILGASGILMGITINQSLTPGLWLEVGSAVVTFMIFAPLTQLASYSAGVRVGEAEPLESINGMIKIFNERLKSTVQAGVDAIDALNHGDLSLNTSKSSSVFVGNISKMTKQQQRLYKMALNFEETQISRKLRFYNGIVFFIFALLYHVLNTSFNFSSILNSSIIPLVFGLTALIAGLLPLLGARILEPSRNISLILLFIVIVIIGINVLLNTGLPQGQQTNAAGSEFI